MYSSLTEEKFVEKKDKWVIVRVWNPKNENGELAPAHKASSGRGNVGHASLETDKIHASFWPNWERAERAGRKGALKGSAQGRLHESYEDDVHAEDDCQADVIAILYTLDVEKINKEFIKFTESTASDRWSLAGRNKFNIFNHGAGESCSGLIFRLLNEGGIRNLVGRNWDPFSKMFAVAPDAVGRMARLAFNTPKEQQYYQYAKATEQLPIGLLEASVERAINPHKMNKSGEKSGDNKCYKL